MAGHRNRAFEEESNDFLVPSMKVKLNKKAERGGVSERERNNTKFFIFLHKSFQRAIIFVFSNESLVIHSRS